MGDKLPAEAKIDSQGQIVDHGRVQWKIYIRKNLPWKRIWWSNTISRDCQYLYTRYVSRSWHLGAGLVKQTGPFVQQSQKIIAGQRVHSSDMGHKQFFHINTLVQSSCKFRTGERLHKAILHNGAGKSVMSYFTSLLIADHLKTPLQPYYIQLTTANNNKLVNKGYTLILSNVGRESMYIYYFSRTIICFISYCFWLSSFI